MRDEEEVPGIRTSPAPAGAAALTITRVINACVLFELGEAAVLTDPYFTDHWFMRFNEPIGLSVEQLPKLAAIIGGHSVFDHWQPASLAAYPYKGETVVYVATRSMGRKARRAGFSHVELLQWGDERQLASGLHLEVAPAQMVTGLKVNSYVLTRGHWRVFFGSEARDLEPLQRYRAVRPAVDLVLVPINGARLLGHKLVMDGHDAIEAARILGARTLVPIHYSQASIPPLLQTRSSPEDLRRLAAGVHDIDVVWLEPGQRWVMA
jgi:L-ascorbate metabolism protein UlaG (beta-lactamase superfamily)